MNNDKTYSLAAIARELGLPDTTVVTWKDRYIEYIPSVKVGNRTRYPAIVKEIIKTIKLCSDKGLETQDIAKELTKRFGMNASSTDDKTELLITNDSPMGELVEQNKQLLQAMGKMYQEMQQLAQTVEELKGNSEVSIKETKAVQTTLEQVETKLDIAAEAQNSKVDWAVHSIKDTLQEIEGKKKKGWLRNLIGG